MSLKEENKMEYKDGFARIVNIYSKLNKKLFQLRRSFFVFLPSTNNRLLN
jgi:hypothetical protein